MNYELVSTRSWNVLGTFDDEHSAQSAVADCMTHGASLYDVVVYVCDEHGNHSHELAERDLAEWAHAQSPHAAAA